MATISGTDFGKLTVALSGFARRHSAETSPLFCKT